MVIKFSISPSTFYIGIYKMSKHSYLISDGIFYERIIATKLFII